MTCTHKHLAAADDALGGYDSTLALPALSVDPPSSPPTPLVHEDRVVDIDDLALGEVLLPMQRDNPTPTMQRDNL